MAHFNQAKKAKIAPTIKDILKKYGMTGTLSVENYSGVRLKLSKGKLDILGASSYVVEGNPAPSYEDVNVFHYKEIYTSNPSVVQFLDEVVNALKGEEYFDHSDSQSDYFRFSHYFWVSVGQWDKPYILL